MSKRMNVLVACEESQAVTIQLRKRGHRAFSCDLMECSGGHPEWHIKGDAVPLLNGFCKFQTMNGEWHEIEGKWDMIIGFPPCTKTSNAGARHLYKGGKLNLQRYFDGMCGKAFFMTLWHADCEKVILENPTPSSVFEYQTPTQAVQPYHHVHPFTKKTLLWERGVDPLVPTNIVEPERTWCPSGSYSGRNDEKHRGMFTTDRAKNRSKTFSGIAEAMAEQWAGWATDAIKEAKTE